MEVPRHLIVMAFLMMMTVTVMAKFLPPKSYRRLKFPHHDHPHGYPPAPPVYPPPLPPPVYPPHPPVYPPPSHPPVYLPPHHPPVHPPHPPVYPPAPPVYPPHAHHPHCHLPYNQFPYYAINFDHEEGYGKHGGYGKTDFGGLYYVAFLGKSCADKSIYDLYWSAGHNDTYYARHSCGCPTLKSGYTNYACSYNHYKSIIVTEWDKFCIDKVRVSVFKWGKEAVYFIFDGHGSTFKDFFSQDKLLFTTYDDLDSHTDTNYFSIDGHVQRRFFINEAYGGYCKKDKGWHAVIDAKDSDDKCKWTDQKCYPAFLYSGDDGSTVWEHGTVENGDIFVISVKLSSYAPPQRYTDLSTCH